MIVILRCTLQRIFYTTAANIIVAEKPTTIRRWLEHWNWQNLDVTDKASLTPTWVSFLVP